MNEDSSGPSLKRKTIHDFFQRPNQDQVKKLKCIEKERNDLPAKVPGLRVIDDFVTHQEEIELLGFLDEQPWRTDLLRRVIHYGGTYCLMPPRTATAEERKAIEKTIIEADTIPSCFDFLIQRMIRDGIYEEFNTPTYCIVNEYRNDQGISAHVENFKFISPVCGLTLGDGDWIRFHELTAPDDGSVRSGKAAKASKTGRRVDVWLPSRSLLVMSGEAREKWQHEIVRS